MFSDTKLSVKACEMTLTILLTVAPGPVSGDVPGCGGYLMTPFQGGKGHVLKHTLHLALVESPQQVVCQRRQRAVVDKNWQRQAWFR